MTITLLYTPCTQTKAFTVLTLYTNKSGYCTHPVHKKSGYCTHPVHKQKKLLYTPCTQTQRLLYTPCSESHMSLTTTPPYWRLTSDKCRMPAPPQCSITGLYQFVFYTISGGHHFPPKRKDDRLPWLRSPSLLYAAKSFETLFLYTFFKVVSDMSLTQKNRKVGFRSVSMYP